MRKIITPLFFGGLFMFLIAGMAFWATMNKKNIKEDGFIVEVKVLNPPSSCEDIPNKGLRMELEYRGKVFIKRVNQKQCAQILGRQTLQMLSDKEQDYFIFIDDYNPYDFIYPFLFFGFGIFCIFKGAQEKRKRSD